ncbi:uncharacterized protein LOC132192637 [Neocloeon triangulifer]|uniref:uncharacterized protein LOC132192637 n=1 Tax=Neocloeon triangulifer TaxID=2078957 RepID=UPI00286EC795|nr:uncharacterized protein LOC132192637 [Neocloeon triangulifer]
MNKRRAHHALFLLLFLVNELFFVQPAAGANCTSKSANENSECRLINGGESYEPGESESCTCTNPKCHGKSSSLICNDDGQWYTTAKSDGTKFECHSCKNIDCVIKTNLFHNCKDVKRHYKNNEGDLKCTCKSDNKIKILKDCDAATGDFKIKTEVGSPSSCDELTPTTFPTKTTTTATTETLSSNSSDPNHLNIKSTGAETTTNNSTINTDDKINNGGSQELMIIVIAAVASVAALLFLILLCYCCCKKDRNKRNLIVDGAVVYKNPLSL